VPEKTFAHAQILHPSNVMYLPPEDHRKHLLNAEMLTLCLFRVLELEVLGCFLFLRLLFRF
jgi:nitrate reductase NapE component